MNKILVQLVKKNIFILFLGFVLYKTLNFKIDVMVTALCVIYSFDLYLLIEYTIVNMLFKNSNNLEILERVESSAMNTKIGVPGISRWGEEFAFLVTIDENGKKHFITNFSKKYLELSYEFKHDSSYKIYPSILLYVLWS